MVHVQMTKPIHPPVGLLLALLKCSQRPSSLPAVDRHSTADLVTHRKALALQGSTISIAHIQISSNVSIVLIERSNHGKKFSNVTG